MSHQIFFVDFDLTIIRERGGGVELGAVTMGLYHIPFQVS